MVKLIFISLMIGLIYGELCHWLFSRYCWASRLFFVIIFGLMLLLVFMPLGHWSPEFNNFPLVEHIEIGFFISLGIFMILFLGQGRGKHGWFYSIFRWKPSAFDIALAKEGQLLKTRLWKLCPAGEVHFITDKYCYHQSNREAWGWHGDYIAKNVYDFRRQKYIDIPVLLPY